MTVVVAGCGGGGGGGGAAPPAVGPFLSGRLVDSVTGFGVESASVTLASTPQTTTTNATGNFSFSSVTEAGTHTLTFQKPGFVTNTVEFTLTQADVADPKASIRAPTAIVQALVGGVTATVSATTPTTITVAPIPGSTISTTDQLVVTIPPGAAPAGTTVTVFTVNSAFAPALPQSASSVTAAAASFNVTSSAGDLTFAVPVNATVPLGFQLAQGTALPVVRASRVNSNVRLQAAASCTVNGTLVNADCTFSLTGTFSIGIPFMITSDNSTNQGSTVVIGSAIDPTTTFSTNFTVPNPVFTPALGPTINAAQMNGTLTRVTGARVPGVNDVFLTFAAGQACTISQQNFQRVIGFQGPPGLQNGSFTATVQLARFPTSCVAHSQGGGVGR